MASMIPTMRKGKHSLESRLIVHDYRCPLAIPQLTPKRAANRRGQCQGHPVAAALDPAPVLVTVVLRQTQVVLDHDQEGRREQRCLAIIWRNLNKHACFSLKCPCLSDCTARLQIVFSSHTKVLDDFC